MHIRIATRKSPLALWQAHHVADALRALDPGLEVSLVERVTKGDKILDQALSKVGGKDLFVKEIEEALLTGEAEVAVHSLKDVPTELPEGLEIMAYPAREDPRDALVSPHGYTLATLPSRAVVGTSSLRRAAQLLAARPDLEIKPIRGNVQTRLQRCQEQGMAATVLAYAGLLRLKLEHLATDVLGFDVSMPAIGQGILAVEGARANGVVAALLGRLDVPASRAAATAERAMLRRLQGGCQVPIAGHARIFGDELVLIGLVAELDGSTVIRVRESAPVAEAEELGIFAAEELLRRGAAPILDSLQASPPA